MDEVVQQYDAMDDVHSKARGLSQAAMEAGLIARGHAATARALIACFRDALAALQVAGDPSAASPSTTTWPRT